MPTVVRIRGWGFALVNLPVVLVYGYGGGSCHLDFCRDVGFPSRKIFASRSDFCFFTFCEADALFAEHPTNGAPSIVNHQLN